MVVDPELDFNGKLSTVVDLSEGMIEILREGKIANDLIRGHFINVKF